MQVASFTAKTSVLVLAAALTVAAGCRRNDDDDDQEGPATVTSALQAQAQAGITDGVIDTDGSYAPEPEEAARIVAEYPMRGLRPAGCATKTREGDVVTLHLDGCTGPFGRVVIDGTLIAAFSKSSSSTLRVDVHTGEGTTGSGDPLRYAAYAEVRFDGTQRFLTYHGQSSGTTVRGRPFSRETDLSVAADFATHCATFDGTSKGTIGRYEIDLAIEGLRGCRDACPNAGLARATVDGPLVRDASVEVAFDGSNEAHVKVDARRKREFDVTLDCEAAETAD
jgi:hypothetical protein